VRIAEDDEVVAWKVASLLEAGTHIMGRATHELDLIEVHTFPGGTAIHRYQPTKGNR